MYRKFISVSYVLNIVFQAFFTLLTPAAIFFLISWLLVSYASAPSWIYAPFLIVGILLGLYSMVKFILSAMAGYERLEKQREAARLADTEEAERRARLRKELGLTVSESEASEEKSTSSENTEESDHKGGSSPS